MTSEPPRLRPDKYGCAQTRHMGAMNVCTCGWTIVSPMGAEDVKKHTLIHLQDAHPGIVIKPEEIMAHIKQI